MEETLELIKQMTELSKIFNKIQLDFEALITLSKTHLDKNAE